jgi:hypothetical protein
MNRDFGAFGEPHNLSIKTGLPRRQVVAADKADAMDRLLAP